MPVSSVLIADDNADLCWLLAGILRGEGFEVDVCQDADVGIQKSAHRDYSAILVEPDPAAGFAPLIDYLADRRQGLGCVVLATTDRRASVRDEWSGRGAFGLLQKPLTAKGLRSAIVACSQHHEAQLPC